MAATERSGGGVSRLWVVTAPFGVPANRSPLLPVPTVPTVPSSAPPSVSRGRVVSSRPDQPRRLAYPRCAMSARTTSGGRPASGKAVRLVIGVTVCPGRADPAATWAYRRVGSCVQAPRPIFGTVGRAGRMVLFDGSSPVAASGEDMPIVRKEANVGFTPMVASARRMTAGGRGRRPTSSRRAVRSGRLYPGQYWTPAVVPDKIAYRDDWIRGSGT